MLGVTATEAAEFSFEVGGETELNAEPDKRSDSGSGRGTGGPADRSVDAEPGSPQSLTSAPDVR